MDWTEEFGKQTFEQLKDQLGDKYDNLSDEQKKALQNVAKRYAELTAKGFVGDVDDSELLMTRAALKNFEVAATLQIRTVLADTLQNVLAGVGVLARKFVLG